MTRAAAALLLVALPVLSGCLERTVSVTSEPPGAIVWLNNAEVGRTPVTTGFLFYGDYDLQVRKDGYEALTTHHDLSSPIYEQPPLDLVATALPVRIHTTRDIKVELQPLPDDTPEAQRALIDRASDMRRQVLERTP